MSGAGPKPRPAPAGRPDLEQYPRWAERASLLAAVVVVAVGAAVLLGWIAGIDSLTTIVSTLPAMRMTTAACLIALAIALLALRARTQVATRAAAGLGALVVAVALLALLASVVPDLAAVFPTTDPRTGAPSVTAAIGLAALGLAVVCADLGGPRFRLATPTIAVAALVSFFALVGYAYDVDYLRGGAGRNGLAVHTAACLAILTLGLASARPSRGLLSPFRGGTGLDAQGRRLIGVAVAVPIAIGLLVLLGTDLALFDDRVAASLVTVVTTLLLIALSVAFLRRSREAERIEREALRAVTRVQRSFRAVADSAIEAIVTADANGEIVYVNPATERIFGWSGDELIGRPLTVLMPERYHAAHAAGLERYLFTGEKKVIGNTVDLEGLRRDGSVFPLSLSLSDWESDGEVFFTGVLADISERVEAQSQNRLLADIVDASEDAVFSRDLDGRVTSWNHGAERLYGWSAEEVIGGDATFHVPAERRGELDGMLASALSGTVVSDVDTMRVRKDGGEVEVSLTITPLRDPAGAIVGVATIARDVTQRRQMEHAVADERARLADAQRIASLGSYELNIDTGEMVFSRQMLLNYGFEADLLDSPPSREVAMERVHPDDIERVKARNARLMENAEPFVDSYRVVWPDGEIRTMEVHAGILRTSDGSRRMVGTSRDITAEREAERAKDEFFGLVSHELRTPLTSIIGYTDLIRDYERDAMSTQAIKWVDVIDRNARRQLRLVQDLLMLARLEARRFEIQLEPIDLGSLVATHVEDARDAASKAGIAIDLADARVGMISGDPHRLGQVVENLISNAVKFSPAGSRVAVELRDVGAQTVLDVSDRGIGIPEGEVNKVFDRLYRASTASEMHIQGTGLGLTIVKAIVEEHGGTIGVASRVGEGTRFRVVLPHPPADDDAPAREDAGGREAAALHDVRGD